MLFEEEKKEPGIETSEFIKAALRLHDQEQKESD